MYILKNAWTNIVRSKGRSILIGIIVLVIAVAACLSLSVRDAAAHYEREGIANLRLTASITLNIEKFRETQMQQNTGEGNGGRFIMRGIPTPTLEEQRAFALFDEVVDFYYRMETALNAHDFDPYSTEEEDEEDTQPETQGPMGGQAMAMSRVSMGDLRLVGASSTAVLDDFAADGPCRLKGEDSDIFDFAAAGFECIISDELAEFNGLAVGSTLTLVNPDLETETYTLTVVGLYENDNAAATESGMPSNMDPANVIYVSAATVEAIVEDSTQNAEEIVDERQGTRSTALIARDTCTFSFAGAADMESFEAKARAAGLAEHFDVTSPNLTSFTAGLEPLKTVIRITTLFLIGVLVVGALMLVVINLLSIRERKYEIGVLAAIGMKKPKVMAQFLAEMLCVTMIAVLLGAGVGAATTPMITQSLLASSTQLAKDQQADGLNFGGNVTFGGGQRPSGGMAGAPVQIGPGMSLGQVDWGGEVTYVESLNATLNLAVLGQLLAIGFLLTLLSGSVALLYILRYEPLKILSERT